MVIELIVITPSGKKHVVYRSVFSHVDIKLENGVVTANAVVNPEAAEKLRAKWLASRSVASEISSTYSR